MAKTKKLFLGIGVLAAIAVITFAFAIAASGSDGGVIEQNAEGVTVAASAVTSSINYQGRLTDSAGEPLSGTYTMTFRLYEVASGGTALDMDTHSVEVTNGLFSTDMSFAQKYFDGRDLWLGITVGIDPEMSPRQEFKPVPYAQSLKPGAVINGSVSGSVLEVNNDLSYGDGICIGTTGDDSEGVQLKTIGDYSQGVLAYTYGDNGDGFWAETSGDGSDGFVAKTSGDNSDGVYVLTSGDRSKGVHAVTYGDGSFGFNADTYGKLSPGVLVNTSGDSSPGVLANTTGDYSYGVWANTLGDNSTGVWVNTFGDNSFGIFTFTDGKYSDAVAALTLGDASEGVCVETYGNQSTGVRADTYGDHSFGVATRTYGDHSFGASTETYGLGSDAFSAFTYGKGSDGVFVSTSGESSKGVCVGTHGDNSTGVFAVTTGDNSCGVLAASEKYNAIYANTERSDHKYGVYTPDKMCAMSYDTDSNDVAEYFAVHEDPEPGTVMVIGEDSKLECSTTAYDTTVAGIVSTAPGVSLGTNESGNEGEKLIAVAGRVPCKVDATYVPIMPGDLLTTSDTSGHAMKATNPQIGTILGKALEPLDSGTGVIEVLVTLQ